MRTARSGAVAIVLSLACATAEPSMSEPPAEYPFATAMFACAPWDGAAIEISLSAQPVDEMAPIGSEISPPFISLSIYRSLSEIGNGRFDVSDPRVAGASRCDSAGACESATAGWVRIHETSPARELLGDFEIQLEGGETLNGGFEAIWHERPVHCG